MKTVSRALTLLGMFAIITLVGCASVQSVSLTPIPKERSKQVTVQTSRVVVLGLNFDNDFVNTITDGLKNQCPKGLVTGILTKDEVIDYFIMLVYKRQITATGYCVGEA